MGCNVWISANFRQPFCQSANILFLLTEVAEFSNLNISEKNWRLSMEINETEMMLKGYGLTTAEIFYRIPD